MNHLVDLSYLDNLELHSLLAVIRGPDEEHESYSKVVSVAVRRIVYRGTDGKPLHIDDWLAFGSATSDTLRDSLKASLPHYRLHCLEAIRTVGRHTQLIPPGDLQKWEEVIFPAAREYE